MWTGMVSSTRMKWQKLYRWTNTLSTGLYCYCEVWENVMTFIWQEQIGTLTSQAIYDMLGAGSTKPQDTAEERAKNIFNRFLKIKNLSKYIWAVSNDFVQRMDENNDGTLTEEEFLKGCLLVIKIFSHLIYHISHIYDNHQIQSNIKQVQFSHLITGQISHLPS